MPARVVILIFTHKPRLEWYEEIALRQCFKILGHYPVRLVCPEGLDLSAYRQIAPAIQPDFIPGHWLASVRAYNRLKILPYLYQRYARFEYMLTYELDAFVFRDELEYWCQQAWDFIGAPWFEGHMQAGVSSSPVPGVNSGLSLRRIDAMLQTLQTWRLIRPVQEVFSEWQRSTPVISPRSLWWLVRNLTWRNCFHYRCNHYTDNEDMFWACAGHRIPGFRVAPYEDASRFSFECNPDRLLAEQGGKLPFGCHKWMGINPGFWQPFIEAEGYKFPRSARLGQ